MSEAAGAITPWAYHQRTQHHLDRYAAGPETLDWDAQPDPFRRYDGCPEIPLPLTPTSNAVSFGDLHRPGTIAPVPLNLNGLGRLLELSLGLSAWKQYGPDRWALRCNPSSGNLHPTEGYLVCRALPDLADGVYHYRPDAHLLEQRPAAATGRAAGSFLRGPAPQTKPRRWPPRLPPASTLSPGLRAVTPSPTASMTPATSPPGAKGRSGRNW